MYFLQSVFYTAKARLTDTYLIRTPHYYRQFALSPGKETPTLSLYSIHLTQKPVNRDLF